MPARKIAMGLVAAAGGLVLVSGATGSAEAPNRTSRSLDEARAPARAEAKSSRSLRGDSASMNATETRRAITALHADVTMLRGNDDVFRNQIAALERRVKALEKKP